MDKKIDCIFNCSIKYSFVTLKEIFSVSCSISGGNSGFCKCLEDSDTFIYSHFEFTSFILIGINIY